MANVRHLVMSFVIIVTPRNLKKIEKLRQPGEIQNGDTPFSPVVDYLFCL